MSPNAHITSHRKPRKTATQSWVIRTGVAGGVLSTLAVAGTASASTAVDKPAEATQEMPAFNAALTTSIAQSAVATQQTAVDYQVRAQVDEATGNATADAKKAKDEADRKAEAERKEAEAQQKRDAEQTRASRGGARTTLGTKAAAADETSTPAATGSVAALISFLKSKADGPNGSHASYVMGATGPSAYDCSGLVMAAYKQIGIDLPRVSQDQSTAGTQVGLGNLQPGDILYWGPAGSAYHVAVYIGGGKFIGAQNPGVGVVERDMSYSPPTGAVRVL
ncbi:glycoside hydrolase [Streptomyces mashuensis]|uniref:Glycoside hydrolase n=1 Tax=Streptomyces mashuensis TaxID=33904 RepID=A0A919B620_9ACTN|nr:C40 family peptidase [Streptomyces mashuensis]GHF56720.1 glycoside hydrolase [Streptomyces mashuensis]